MFPTVRSWLELIKEKVSAASIPKVLILKSNHLGRQQTLPELTWRKQLQHPLSSTPPGRLRVRNVGPCWNRHLRGPADCRRPVRHPNASPQKEEPQAPEEDETTGGRCLQSVFLTNNLASLRHIFFSSATRRSREQQSGPGHAARRQLRRRVLTCRYFLFCRPPIPCRRLGKK